MSQTITHKTLDGPAPESLGPVTSEEAKLFTRSLDRGLAELVLQAIWLEAHGKPAKDLMSGLDGAEYFRGLQKKRIQKVAALFKLKSERSLAVNNERTG